MSGNREGGLKCAAKNLARDPEFYRKIGTKGGRNGKTGGFAANRDLARKAGELGGRISRRSESTRLTPEQAAKIRQEYNEGATCNEKTTAYTSSEYSSKSLHCADCKQPKHQDELDDMGLCDDCPAVPHDRPRLFGVFKR